MCGSLPVSVLELICSCIRPYKMEICVLILVEMQRSTTTTTTTRACLAKRASLFIALGQTHPIYNTVVFSELDMQGGGGAKYIRGQSSLYTYQRGWNPKLVRLVGLLPCLAGKSRFSSRSWVSWGIFMAKIGEICSIFLKICIPPPSDFFPILYSPTPAWITSHFPPISSLLWETTQRTCISKHFFPSALGYVVHAWLVSWANFTISSIECLFPHIKRN